MMTYTQPETQTSAADFLWHSLQNMYSFRVVENGNW